VSYHNIKTKEEKIKDILLKAQSEGIRHLSKNKLSRLIPKVIYGKSDYVHLFSEPKNPYEFKEEIEETVKLKTFDEFIEFMTSKDKIGWLKLRGYEC
jgi:hypothetical protein